MSDIPVSTMTRRTGGMIKYIAAGFAVLACLYGLFCYHELNTRLRSADEKVDRLRTQHESVSAQLQGKRVNLQL